jgi:hypothetical protein
MFGVLFMHGLATPDHDMTTHAAPRISAIDVVGLDTGSVTSSPAPDAAHAGTLCLWVLTGGIALAAVGRVLRNPAYTGTSQPALTPAHPRVTWPGPAPPGHCSYFELNSIRR